MNFELGLKFHNYNVEFRFEQTPAIGYRELRSQNLGYTYGHNDGRTSAVLQSKFHNGTAN